MGSKKPVNKPMDVENGLDTDRTMSSCVCECGRHKSIAELEAQLSEMQSGMKKRIREEQSRADVSERTAAEEMAKTEEHYAKLNERLSRSYQHDMVDRDRAHAKAMEKLEQKYQRQGKELEKCLGQQQQAQIRWARHEKDSRQRIENLELENHRLSLLLEEETKSRHEAVHMRDQAWAEREQAIGEVKMTQIRLESLDSRHRQHSIERESNEQRLRDVEDEIAQLLRTQSRSHRRVRPSSSAHGSVSDTRVSALPKKHLASISTQTTPCSHVDQPPYYGRSNSKLLDPNSPERLPMLELLHGLSILSQPSPTFQECEQDSTMRSAPLSHTLLLAQALQHCCHQNSCSDLRRDVFTMFTRLFPASEVQDTCDP